MSLSYGAAMSAGSSQECLKMQADDKNRSVLRELLQKLQNCGSIPIVPAKQFAHEAPSPSQPLLKFWVGAVESLKSMSTSSIGLFRKESAADLANAQKFTQQNLHNLRLLCCAVFDHGSGVAARSFLEYVEKTIPVRKAELGLFNGSELEAREKVILDTTARQAAAKFDLVKNLVPDVDTSGFRIFCSDDEVNDLAREVSEYDAEPRMRLLTSVKESGLELVRVSVFADGFSSIRSPKCHSLTSMPTNIELRTILQREGQFYKWLIHSLISKIMQIWEHYNKPNDWLQHLCEFLAEIEMFVEQLIAPSQDPAISAHFCTASGARRSRFGRTGISASASFTSVP